MSSRQPWVVWDGRPAVGRVSKPHLPAQDSAGSTGASSCEWDGKRKAAVHQEDARGSRAKAQAPQPPQHSTAQTARPREQEEESADVRALRQLPSAATPDAARLCALLTLVCVPLHLPCRFCASIPFTRYPLRYDWMKEGRDVVRVFDKNSLSWQTLPGVKLSEYRWYPTQVRSSGWRRRHLTLLSK